MDSQGFFTLIDSSDDVAYIQELTSFIASLSGQPKAKLFVVDTVARCVVISNKPTPNTELVKLHEMAWGFKAGYLANNGIELI